MASPRIKDRFFFHSLTYEQLSSGCGDMDNSRIKVISKAHRLHWFLKTWPVLRQKILKTHLHAMLRSSSRFDLAANQKISWPFLVKRFFFAWCNGLSKEKRPVFLPQSHVQTTKQQQRQQQWQLILETGSNELARLKCCTMLVV